MKVSCLPLSFFNDLTSGKISIRDWARIGVKAGLDGIDICIPFLKNHTPVYLDMVKKDLKEEGMSIIMITTYPDFTNPDKIQRERELEYLEHDITLASELGAKYLRVLAGQAYPEVKIKDGIKWATYYLKKATIIAEKFKVRLVYENHAKPSAWNYIDFSHPTGIFLEIAEAIKDSGIKINFDTANTIAYGDDSILVLKKIIDRVETIHAADTSTQGSLDHVLIGTGLVPFKEIFTLLKQNKFDGWICIEENSGTGIDGIIKSVKFIRKVWEEA